MITTTRRGIQYPDPATRADRADIALHLQNLAVPLDNDVLFNQGTDAARQAAAHQAGGGRFWWSTDTKLLWYDDGTTWQQTQTPALSVPNVQSANYTLAIADSTKTVVMNVAGANTLTVPTHAAVAFPVGTTMNIAQYNVGQTTITPAAGVTLRSYLNMYKLAGQFAMCSLIQLNNDEWFVSGNLVP